MCWNFYTIFKDQLAQRAKLMPQWWALDALASIQNGAPIWRMAVNYAILAAFAAALILIAIYRLATEDDVRKFV
jgi:ABC-2 type transport system permease protein